MKQAKEEAQAEIEAYRQDRERQYREHEAKVKFFSSRAMSFVKGFANVSHLSHEYASSA